MSNGKEAARSMARAARKAMTAEERKTKSAAILGRLTESEQYRKCGRIMVYVSRPEEVDTLDLITAALRAGKEVVVPKVDRGTGTIVPCRISGLDELCEGEFSVLEPKVENRVEKESIGMFIVPGVAFDVKGGRIGHGKGYFDRFLAGIERNGIVGLAFESQVLPEVDSKKHDVPVSAIFTERRVITC